MASFGTAETSLLFNTSGIRAATDNPQRINTAMDGGGSMQKRDLLNANLVVKQLYTDVQLLNRLFQKAYGYLFFP